MGKVESILKGLVKEMENGTVPWTQTWVRFQNLKTRKPYRGVNQFILMSGKFDTPYFLTFRQAKQMGGYVKPGERGTSIVFWKPVVKKREIIEDNPDELSGDVQEERYFVLRGYTVFNLSQIEGIKVPQPDRKEIETADDLIKRMSAALHITVKDTNRARAFYKKSDDTINIPPGGFFPNPIDRVRVFFHELIHATGAKYRLNRTYENKWFGSKEYAFEELVAEIGSAFLCVDNGIPPDIKNSSAYLSSWIKALKRSPRLLLQAAGKAQKAVDWIHQNMGVEKGRIN